MRRALLWGVLMLASLLIVWIIIPEQIRHQHTGSRPIRFRRVVVVVEH